MKIKFKRLIGSAKPPTQSREGDACWDLTTTGIKAYIDGGFTEYGTGIAVAIPEDHVGLLFCRSSVSNKDLILANCVGVIDPNYRGEISLRFKTFPLTTFRQPETYAKGDKIGQLLVIPRPYLEFEEVENLNELGQTNRGDNGYGSSGN